MQGENPYKKGKILHRTLQIETLKSVHKNRGFSRYKNNSSPTFTIEVRPVYHWTEKRIKGHLVVCFLSFLFMRVLETALNKDVSTERIKEALRSITLTGFNINGKEYYLKNKMDKVVKALFKILKVNEPANVTAKEEFRI